MDFLYLDNFNIVNAKARLLFEAMHSPWLTRVMIFFTDIGSPGSIFLYCLVLVMLMWLHRKHEHLIQFILTVGLAAIVAVLTKEITKIPRPSGGLISEIGYSFASAHAMIATVFFALVIHSYRNHFKAKLARALFVMANVLLVLLVGLSRVYLGVHYMTDVLAGFFMGLILSCLSILIYNRHINTL